MSENVRFLQAEQQVIINVIHGHDSSLISSDLQSLAHQVIFETASELRMQNITPDLVTMNHRLTEDGRLEDAGGISYLSDLYASGLPTKDLEPYEEIVREESSKANVLAFARSLIDDAEHGAPAADLLVRAQTEPLRMVTNTKTDNTIEVQDAVYEVLDEIDARRRGVLTRGVSTPWNYINDKTNGLQPGDLITVAGRPSMGKTAFGGQVATHVARKHGPVFIGSLEMDSSSLIERMLSGEARVDSNAIRAGRLNDRQFERLQTAAETFQDDHPILVNDTPRLSATELRIEMAKQHAKHGGLKLAVIDYLGLLKEDKSGQQRYKEVGDSVKILRATARELQIPVVLLCQLNRSCEYREDKRPTLADLRESGDIEQDSDVVIMLYRDEYYCNDCNAGRACEKDHQGTAEALIRKQRKGPTGSVSLVWLHSYTRFENMVTSSNFGGGEEPEESTLKTEGIQNTENSQQNLFGYKAADGEKDEIPF